MLSERNKIISVNRDLLKDNIKSFIEIQYGEIVDESMEHYIDLLIGQTEIGMEY